MSKAQPPDTRGCHGKGNHPAAIERHDHGEVDHKQKAATEVAGGKGLVGNCVHFGFVAHVREKGVVKHTRTVESNVGHHEHDERPYPSRRNTEVGREGQQNTGNRTKKGEDLEPPHLDHAPVSDDAQRRRTDSNEECTDHDGGRIHGVGRPLAAEQLGRDAVRLGKEVGEPGGEDGRSHRSFECTFPPIVGTVPTDSLVVVNRRCCSFHERAWLNHLMNSYPPSQRAEPD